MVKKIIKTEDEWKKILTPEQFNILRKKGTEAAGSCSLLKNNKKGVYYCVACGNKLFKSSGKFKSGTGWPSFTEPFNNKALDYNEDRSLLLKRTEVLCGKCGGHLGHVFQDGPPPTFKRYCINGVILKFKGDKSKK